MVMVGAGSSFSVAACSGVLVNDFRCCLMSALTFETVELKKSMLCFTRNIL